MVPQVPIPAPPQQPFTPEEKAAEVDGTLKKLGEGVEKLSKNLTVVTGKEEWKITLFGALKGEVIYSSARPLIPGAPMLLFPGSPFGLSNNTIDVTGKSSLLGAAIEGPEVCGFRAGGLVLGALYSETVVADRYGFLPLEAFGELKNEDWRFAAGLQFDVFNPLQPNMVNFNNLYASGNTGAYRGQARFERYWHPSCESQITLKGAIGEPLPTIISDSRRLTDTAITEDNGWPNVESRIAIALGPVEGEGLEARRPFEMGISGVLGQIRDTSLGGHRVVADVRGIGTDARWKINPCFGVQGELFYGQTLGTYLGGTLQNVNSATLEGIRAAGGWAEIYYYLMPCVHIHIGAGLDDPLDSDVAVAQIVRNQTYFTTLFWDVTKDVRFGLELSYRETSYKFLPDNEGMLVHTQFLLKF